MESTALEEDRHSTSESSQKTVISITISRTTLLTIIVIAVSVAAFLYFFLSGMTNVYGDGVAHVNIARKVVDSADVSLRQRYIQIGSPWLPVQTL